MKPNNLRDLQKTSSMCKGQDLWSVNPRSPAKLSVDSGRISGSVCSSTHKKTVRVSITKLNLMYLKVYNNR